MAEYYYADPVTREFLFVSDRTTRAIIELINLIVITLIMLHGIKQKAIVNKEGKVELSVPEMRPGTYVEIILLVEPSQEE